MQTLFTGTRVPMHDGSSAATASRRDHGPADASSCAPALDGSNGSHSVVGALFQRASTAGVSPDFRFDLWRHLSPATVTEPASAIGADGYHGELEITTPLQGTTFMRIANDPMLCRFTEADPDGITVIRVCAGTVHVRGRSDFLTQVDAASGFVLFDRDQPVDLIEPTAFVMTGLKLPRTLVAAALGTAPTKSGPPIRPFAHSGPLLAGLQRQFDVLSERARQTDAADISAAVATARSLAMTLLAQRNPRRRMLPDTFDDALFVAARHQLELYAGNPDLTAGGVAAMLGCSRSRLYQLFKREGATVGDVLRDARLRRAARLLQSDAKIGEIAWRCGYTEFSAFDKAFRHRFGMTPSDYRHQVARVQP